MFHSLTLIKVEYGGAEYFFKTFFEVTFVDRHFAAKRLDSDGFANMLKEYFAGERQQFDLQRVLDDTAFRMKVWRALERIPFGETRSYREIAIALGRPTAARAVGRANATNPICLIVPCHRVIGADGSLTGFAFGEAIKRRLLDHEQSSSARTRAA